MNHGELNQLLLGRIEEVCQYLLPQGTKKGNEWKFGDLQGGSGNSGGVVMNGSKAGSWADFADSSCRGNSLVSLWCQVRCNDDYPAAAEEIKKYLGVTDSDLKISHRPRKIYTRPSVGEKKEIAKLDERSAVLRYLEDERCLPEKNLLEYKVFSRKDDKGYVFCYYEGEDFGHENIVMLKTVFLERNEKGKKKSFITRDSEPVLFGKGAIPKNCETLIITAGELDAVSWSVYGHPAVSIPMGIQNNNWIESDFEWLERFQTIYINYDSDPKEQEAARALADRLGLERCMNIDLGSYKDANNMLVNGEENPERFIEEAKSLMPPDIELFSEGVDELISEMSMTEEDAPGFDLPWGNDFKLKIRKGEVSAVVGYTGHGKTAVLNHICTHMQANGARGMIASLEMKMLGTKDNFVKCHYGQMTVDPEYIRQAMLHSSLSNMLMVNRKKKRTIDGEKLLEYFYLCSKKYGLDYIVLDNLMMCKLGWDDYDNQQQFIESLQCMADDTGTHTFIVAHPRKPPSAREKEVPPDAYEIKGAGEIANLVDNCISVWRNTKKHYDLAIEKQKSADGNNYGEIEDIKARPDGIVQLAKQRSGIGSHKGWLGSVNLWCKPGMQFHSSQDADPINYSLQ